MPTLTDWIHHRAGVVGLSWPDGVAESSGLERSTLASITSSAHLCAIGRSSRAYIARTLKVSLRELEALARGQLRWIGDERVVDFDRLSPNSASASRPAAPVAMPCKNSHGIPILGRILDTGLVEHDELWTPEDGPRIAARYPQVPDAFALELTCAAPPHQAGTRLVFQVIPPAEFQEGELASITHGAMDVETGFFRVSQPVPMSLQLVRATGDEPEAIVVASADILRAARVIGAHTL